MRFVKGRSGNPEGKRAGKAWRDAIRRAVKRRPAKGAPQFLDLIAERLVELGLAGDMAAIREIGDRLDGKPSQGVEIEGAATLYVVRGRAVPDLKSHAEPENSGNLISRINNGLVIDSNGPRGIEFSGADSLRVL